jgi:hypothetical protein
MVGISRHQYYKEDRMFACGDYVLFEGVIGGTHEGTYLNIPPTDKHLEWRVARYRSGTPLGCSIPATPAGHHPP